MRKRAHPICPRIAGIVKPKVNKVRAAQIRMCYSLTNRSSYASSLSWVIGCWHPPQYQLHPAMWHLRCWKNSCFCTYTIWPIRFISFPNGWPGTFNQYFNVCTGIWSRELMHNLVVYVTHQSWGNHEIGNEAVIKMKTYTATWVL